MEASVVGETMANDPMSGVSVLSFADEVTAELFSFLGATDTARCAKACSHWNRVSKRSRSLWRRFTYDDFGLSVGDASANWRDVYAYIASRFHAAESSDDIESQFVFCDDGSHQPGNGPENALVPTSSCWCTNAFVDHDVDFVSEMPGLHLVTHFGIQNGPSSYTAPVKEALAFASFDMPNLDQARAFDGSTGISLAHTFVRSEISREPPPRSAEGNTPLTGFAFPGIPAAFNSFRRHACRPTVARYSHFKLLSSSKCSDRVSNNIDVCALVTYGVSLPKLGAMIQPAGESTSAPLPPDPSQYRRHHEIRAYPWHIHEEFENQRWQQHQEQVRQLRQLQVELEETRAQLLEQAAAQFQETREEMERMSRQAHEMAEVAAQAIEQQDMRHRQLDFLRHGIGIHNNHDDEDDEGNFDSDNDDSDIDE